LTFIAILRHTKGGGEIRVIQLYIRNFFVKKFGNTQWFFLAGNFLLKANPKSGGLPVGFE